MNSAFTCRFLHLALDRTRIGRRPLGDRAARRGAGIGWTPASRGAHHGPAR
jgi:hypothetical protein